MRYIVLQSADEIIGQQDVYIYIYSFFYRENAENETCTGTQCWGGGIFVATPWQWQPSR